jgi:hypothetical protein
MSPSEGRTPNTDWIFEVPVSGLIRRMARQLSRSPGFSRSDQPDIEQEFRLLLWRKAAKYNAARAKRETFAERIIKNKAASLAREMAAGKRSYRRNSVSLNETVSDMVGSPRELSDFFEESAARRHTGQRNRDMADLAILKQDVADTNHDLDPSLRIFAALLAHTSEYAAGQVLGMSRKQAARHLQALRIEYAARDLAG